MAFDRKRFPNRPSGRLLWLFAVLVLLLALSYVLSEQARQDVAEPSTTSSTSPAPSLVAPGDLDADYYEVLGAAVKEHDPAPGEVSYCPLDDLGRAVCAYGSLTPQLRQEAQDRGRQDINVDPAGWPGSNPQVKIPALEGVEGSKAYSGWLWNRSHLLADSLGGGAVLENLVTGTRTQNVGSAQTGGQYSGGMAFTELLARQYLDDPANAECPLYYAAAPAYTGDELVPRTVLVDVASCDGSLDLRVEVSNTAAGFAIDYADGSHAKQ